MLVALAATLVYSAFRSPAAGAVVPGDFSNNRLAAVASPTDLAVLPDGRALVASQHGALTLVSPTGALTAVNNPPGPLCSDQDRGLLGLTIDPDFATNRFVYLYYTFNKYGTCEDYSAKSPVNRLTRFTLSGGGSPSLGSPVVLIDNIPSFQGIHDGGGVGFGKDGFLYLSIGDLGCDLDDATKCSGSNGNARDTHRLAGKVLRITRDGIAPPSNPFYASGGECRLTGRTNPGKHCKETFAWGLRNPFRLAFDPNAPGTRFFINDVGSATWEEINLGIAGADYGWTICEGMHARGSSADCTNAPPGHVPPIHEYGHKEGCSAITGGAFVPNGVWPSAFNGSYLFADVTCGKIWRLNNGGVTEFASGLGPVTTIRFGPFGSVQALFYTTYANGGEVHRISYSADGHPPIARASASPTNGLAPLDVRFDASASSDLDGDLASYRWDFGDGQSGTGQQQSHRYTANGVYEVRLTVTDRTGLADFTTISIAVGTPPEATITSPESSDLFAVGQIVSLAGTATDGEGNTIPDSGITWRVWRHHDRHEHPFFGPQVGNNLSFVAPVPEDLIAATNSYLRIEMIAVDANGLTTTVSRDLMPNAVRLTFSTEPANLPIEIEEQRFATPLTITSWAGWVIDVTAPPQVDGAGQPLEFSSWSDGGRPSHQLTTPATATTFVASYRPSIGAAFAPVADARVKKSQPTSNQGTVTGLSVLSGTEVDFESVIRFEVAGVTGPVSSALLYIYAYDGTSRGPYVFSTSNEWSETGVTWASRPPPVGSKLASLGSIADQSWVVIDVTKAITGPGTYSFLLAGRSSDSLSFYSRESSRNQPRLVVLGTSSGDATAPGVPSNVKAVASASDTVQLTWKAATDNVGIAGYDLFRDGKLVTSLGAATTFTDSALSPNTSYTYQLRARDTSGNRSALSAAMAVRTPAATRTLTFAPEADARVEEAQPGKNFARSTELRAAGGSGVRVQSFLRFRVNGLPGTVYRATLRLFVPAVKSAGSVDGPTLYPAGNAWSETGVTWSNRPRSNGPKIGDLGAVGDGVWVEYDVTVKVVGNGLYTFMLASGSSDQIRFFSREGATKPQLVIAAFPDGNTRSAAIVDTSPTPAPTAMATPSPTLTAIPTPTATPTPTAPVVLPLRDGFESGLGRWAEVEGLVVQTEHVAIGQQAARATGTGSEQQPGQPAFARRPIGQPQRDLHLAIRVNLLTQGPKAIDLLAFEDEIGRSILTVLVDGNGRIAVRNDRTGEVTRLAELEHRRWYTLEVRVVTGSSGGVELWLDRVLVARGRTDLGDVPVAGIRLGENSSDRSYDVAFDELAVDVRCIGECPASFPIPDPTATLAPEPTPTSEATTAVPEPTGTAAIPTQTPEPDPTPTSTPEPTQPPQPSATPSPAATSEPPVDEPAAGEDRSA